MESIRSFKGGWIGSGRTTQDRFPGLLKLVGHQVKSPFRKWLQISITGPHALQRGVGGDPVQLYRSVLQQGSPDPALSRSYHLAAGSK